MSELMSILNARDKQAQPCRGIGKGDCNPASPTPPFGLMKLAVADPITRPERASCRATDQDKVTCPARQFDLVKTSTATHCRQTIGNAMSRSGCGRWGTAALLSKVVTITVELYAFNAHLNAFE